MAPVADEGDGWREAAKNLGEAILHRRVELGFRTRYQFAEATGLTIKTLGEIERGVRPTYGRPTYATLDQVLGWPAGTVEGILTAEPTTRGLSRGLGYLIPTPPDTPSGMAAVEILRYLWRDDLPIAERLAASELPPSQVFRLLLHIRDRRAQHHAELMDALAKLIDEALGEGLADDDQLG
jgi:transcriptional regulator with XRE-family HTH domain